MHNFINTLSIDQLFLLRKLIDDKLNEVIKQQALSIDFIQRTVCNYFTLTKNQLCFNSRKREIVKARQISIYFCKKLTPEIEEEIAVKHNTGRSNAHLAWKTVKNRINVDKIFSQKVEEINTKLKKAI
jgi:chromosomal replication initiator protein